MSLDLSDLLGQAEEKGLLKKRKKSATSPAKKREEAIYVPIKDRYISVSLVMLQHITVCDHCGSKWESPNQPLLKRKSPKGDIHYSDTFNQEEFNNLPREVEQKQHSVITCASCFKDKNWYPVKLPPNQDKEYLISQLIKEADENDAEE